MKLIYTFNIHIIPLIIILSMLFILIPWYLKQLGRQFASGVYEYWEEKDFIKFKDLLELPKMRKGD